jgi:tetraacyldisaccharide 4'-kinase
MAATCIEPLYRGAICLRNAAFDRGWRAIHRPHVPVISIGNITTGGTGKTPMVACIVGKLQALGRRPAVLMRGYHRDRAGRSDEQELLHELLPGVPVLAQPDRVAAAQRLQREHPDANVIVLDDGFQHRPIGRDLDIVLIDATNPFGFGRLLPRGLLREPPAELQRADAVIVTRADTLTGEQRTALDRQIKALHGHPPLAHTAHVWAGVMDELDRLAFVRTDVLVDGNELGEYQNFNDLRRRACRYAKKHFLGQHVRARSDGHVIMISARGIGKVVSGRRRPDELKVIVELRRMIEHSIVLHQSEDRLNRPDIKVVYHRAVNVCIGGSIRSFLVVVHETRDGRKFYDSHIEKKQTPQPESETASRNGPAKLRASEATESNPILAANTPKSSRPAVCIVAGVGNPRAFVDQAQSTFDVVDILLLPDHASYSASLVQELRRRVQAAGAQAVLTTEKDWVKLRPLLQSDPLGWPVWRPRLSITFLDGEAQFDQRLIEAAHRKSASENRK